MKKKFIVTFLTLGLVFTLSSLFAEENESFKRKTEGPIVFFSPKVPRYEGIAVSAFLSNEYALGVWSDFAVSNLGLGGALEYTFPHFLPLNMDLGSTLNVDYGITIPRWGSTLKSHSDFRIFSSLFIRVPFKFIGLNFAFQPDFGYGVALNHAVGQNGSKVKGWYFDQFIIIAPEFRFSIPVEALQDVEFGFAPFWSMSPEQKETAIQNVGWRAGITWHITDTIKEIIRKHESKKLAALAAAQAEENKRIQEEADRKLKALAEEEEAKRRALQEAADAEAKAKLEAEIKAAEEARIAAEKEAERLAEEARIAAEKEAARVAEENLREEMQTELKKVLRSPERLLGINAEDLKDFTPDGDGVNDTITFHPSTKYLSEAPKSWKIVVSDPFGKVFKTWSETDAIPESITWNGKGDDGSVVFSRETYTTKMSVVLSDKDRERLGRTTVEDAIEGDVNIDVGIVLNKTAANEWRIEMASISFDPNAATFKKLSKAQLEELYNTLDTIAVKVNAIKNSSITIEGYANNVSGTDKENKEELIPLSQLRAQAIANMLKDRGISSDAISAVGMGGANPKASREDRENWWKNRRIEFVIRN